MADTPINLICGRRPELGNAVDELGDRKYYPPVEDI
jgi:hypothetical protein